MIYGERVQQARELQGLTQSALAKLVNVNQSAIARIERGDLQPSGSLLERLAFHTRMLPPFFRRPPVGGFPLGSLRYRARARMSAGERARAHRRAALLWEMTEVICQQRPLRLPPVVLPRLTDEPAAAARIVRAQFGSPPDAPIRHLLHEVELAGALLLVVPDTMPHGDGFSAWVGDAPPKPVIAIANGVTGDRQRFTVGHEVGHLVLHGEQGDPARFEREAWAFAAELLLPERAMRRELVAPVTLAGLLELKPRWRVSVQALVMRARELGIVTDRQYHYLFQQLSKRGWRTDEPMPIPPEAPQALREMVGVLYGHPVEHRLLAHDTQLPPALVRAIIETHGGRCVVSAAPELTSPDHERARVIPFRSREEREGYAQLSLDFPDAEAAERPDTSSRRKHEPQPAPRARPDLPALGE